VVIGACSSPTHACASTPRRKRTRSSRAAARSPATGRCPVARASANAS